MEQPASRHLLVGYTGGVSDLGGIAIPPGLLNLIRCNDPGFPVVVLTLQAAGSKTAEWFRAYLPRFLPDCGVVGNGVGVAFGGRDGAGSSPALQAFRNRWGETKLRGFEAGCLSARIAAEIARDALDRLPEELFGDLESLAPETATAFANAGFVMPNSGTMLNFGRMGDRRFWDETLFWAMPLLLARMLSIPYGIGSYSFEAVDWPADLVLRPLFRDASFLFCRDTDSLEYLKQRDLLNANSGFRPDSTFFFPGCDDAWAAAFMEKHGLRAKEFITVVTRPEIRGPRSPEREKLHADRTTAFVEQWIEATGMPVVLCPESKSEPEYLLELHRSMSPPLREKCICMDAFWTPEQARSLYAKARIVAGHMHSMILALSAGTPVLHIQYAEAGRKAWMLKDIGLEDWLLDLDENSPEELVGAAMSIHDDYPRAEARAKGIRPEMERLATETISEVKRAFRRV